MHKKFTHKFSAGTITVLQEDVVLVKYNPTQKITRKDLQELQDSIKTLIGENHFYAIFDYTEGMPIYTGEAKSFAAISKESNEYRNMGILIAYNWRTRLEIMLYKKLYRPKKKIVVVDNMQEATALVKKAREEEFSAVSMAG